MRFSSVFACAAALVLPSVVHAQQTPQPSPTATASLPNFSQLGKGLWASLTRPPPRANWTAHDAEIPGVVRLTDATYESTFENSEPQDVWVVLIHGKDDEPLSKQFLDIQKNASLLFDKARESKEPQTTGLSAEVNFKFARVDYFEEYHLCYRWLVLRAPILAIVSDRGSTLRFVKPKHMNPTGEFLYKALSADSWREVPVWESSLGPNGDNDWLVENFLWALDEWSRYTKDIPKVVWLLLVPAIGQFLMNWLHSGEEPAAERAQRAAQRAQATPK
ncbi:hypothetical protein Q8F55_003669 [Vanrija albida]|uniref:Thioredoxin-like fold domain-containing protein n=1 Tax=Vanrija albida TaxID=181172 RepID=A0ABR3Q4K6_9TREE